LICTMEGILYIYTFYNDGTYSGGGSGIDSGSSQRGRSVAVRDIANWEISDDKVHIKFHTETDKEKIKQMFIEIYKKRGKSVQEIEQLLKQFFQE
jgi:hypothetical protein